MSLKMHSSLVKMQVPRHMPQATDPIGRSLGRDQAFSIVHNNGC